MLRPAALVSLALLESSAAYAGAGLALAGRVQRPSLRAGALYAAIPTDDDRPCDVLAPGSSRELRDEILEGSIGPFELREEILEGSVGPFGILPGARELAARLESTRSELLEAVLVILCCAVFTVQTLPGLTADQTSVLSIVEYSSQCTFAIQYWLRWYASSLAPSFVFQPLNLVDLASFAPIFLQMGAGLDDQTGPTQTGFALLRLLRILRLQRYVSDPVSFKKLQEALGIQTPADGSSGSMTERALALRVARVISSVLTLLFVATGLIYEAEHEVHHVIPTPTHLPSSPRAWP